MTVDNVTAAAAATADEFLEAAPRPGWPMAQDVTNAQAAEILLTKNAGIRPDLSRRAYRTAKRLFDLVASGAAIAVLLVPGLVLSAVICAKSPGAGPLYSQVRVGRLRKDGSYKLFCMWKFRSMSPDADEKLASLRHLNEADGPLFKIKDDPRVIPGVGTFIRKHSMASVIIGTPGAGELTNSLSSAAKTSPDQQFYDRRPEVVSCDAVHYTSPEFLSFTFFGGSRKARNAFAARVSDANQNASRWHRAVFCFTGKSGVSNPAPALGVAA